MKRYALYYAPPPGPLAEAAARWLGRDAETGTPLTQPYPELEAQTVSPRRYGFHATLKAPFRPATGATEEDLVEVLDAFAADHRPVMLEGLELKLLDGFLALVPAGDTRALNALAADVVTRFEPFRAPLTEAETARRKPETLSPAQRHNLALYGYPYVMDEFRFHMTLSDRLAPAAAERLAALAREAVMPHVTAPFRIDQLVLFGEDEAGLFHHVHRTTLR